MRYICLDPLAHQHSIFKLCVCNLRKTIYALKQTPQAWNDTLKWALFNWRFANTKADTSLFIFWHHKFIIQLLVYVDDVIITGNNDGMISKFVHHLDPSFALKDLGKLSYFLGIQLHYLEYGIMLN